MLDRRRDIVYSIIFQSAVCGKVVLVPLVVAALLADPPYDELTRSPAAPSPEHNVLRKGRRRGTATASSGLGSRDDDGC